jgi:hypothetical protein
MNRPLILALIIWLVTILALIVALGTLSGCAEDRYLTKEEDAEMRAYCEPQPQGCAVLPMHEWKQIEKLLQRMNGLRT